MVKRAKRAEQQNDADQSVLSHPWLRHRRADLVAFVPRRGHLELRRLVDGVANIVVVNCVGWDPCVCEGFRPQTIEGRLVSRGHEHAFDVRNGVLEAIGHERVPLLLAESLPHDVFLGPLARPLKTCRDK